MIKLPRGTIFSHKRYLGDKFMSVTPTQPLLRSSLIDDINSADDQWFAINLSNGYLTIVRESDINAVYLDDYATVITAPPKPMLYPYAMLSGLDKITLPKTLSGILATVADNSKITSVYLAKEVWASKGMNSGRFFVDIVKMWEENRLYDN
jgi:hypothetical protein